MRNEHRQIPISPIKRPHGRFFFGRSQYPGFQIVITCMEPPTPQGPIIIESDNEITATVLRERSRLGNFIRRRVRDPGDAEDILQDVLHEFVQAYRLPEPIEQVSAWLFRVARNRIIDRFRKRREQPLSEISAEEDEDYRLDLALPAEEGGPEAAYARTVLLTALQEAIDELPANQRDVFMAHELEGRGFRELSLESGVSINTLLARKRYAVMHLRTRLQPVYDDLDI